MADFDVPPGIMQLALTVSRILAYGREGFDVFRHCINSIVQGVPSVADCFHLSTGQLYPRFATLFPQFENE